MLHTPTLSTLCKTKHTAYTAFSASLENTHNPPLRHHHSHKYDTVKPLRLQLKIGCYYHYRPIRYVLLALLTSADKNI